MRIVVTGARGMLGRAVVAELQRAGHAVVAATRADADVTDPAAVQRLMNQQRPECVVHCAAYTNVDACEREEALAFAVNAGGTAAVAQACRTVGARLLHVSSDYVFDGRGRRPYREDDTPSPLGVYARTKLRAEEAVQATLDDACIVRTAWLYGTGGYNFPERILERARGKEALRVVDDQVGCPTYVCDLASGMRLLIERGARGIFHVVNHGCCSWYAFAAAILRAAGLEQIPLTAITTAEINRPAPRPSYSVLDDSKFARFAGQPLRSWQEAARAFLQTLSA